MNRNLKTLGKLCGIDRDVVIETTKGGVLSSYKRPKYEMIKTHSEAFVLHECLSIRDGYVGHNGLIWS